MNNAVDKMTKERIYADEFWGVLAKLLEEKYGFTVDDIVFSDERTHCEYCGGELDEKIHRGFSWFTNEYMNFCYTVARRRLEVENRRSEREERTKK